MITAARVRLKRFVLRPFLRVSICLSLSSPDSRRDARTQQHSAFHRLLIGLSQEIGGLFEQVGELLNVLLKTLGVRRLEQLALC